METGEEEEGERRGGGEEDQISEIRTQEGSRRRKTWRGYLPLLRGKDRETYSLPGI